MIRACYIAATVLPFCHAVILEPQAPSYLAQVDIGASLNTPEEEEAAAKLERDGRFRSDSLPILHKDTGIARKNVMRQANDRIEARK